MVEEFKVGENVVVNVDKPCDTELYKDEKVKVIQIYKKEIAVMRLNDYNKAMSLNDYNKKVWIIDKCKVDKIEEPINRPQHYKQGYIQPIEVIEDWKLGFNLGNTIKYIGRAEYKGSKLEDLKKAMWYLNREIERLGNGERVC